MQEGGHLTSLVPFRQLKNIYLPLSKRKNAKYENKKTVLVNNGLRITKAFLIQGVVCIIFFEVIKASLHFISQ